MKLINWAIVEGVLDIMQAAILLEMIAERIRDCPEHTIRQRALHRQLYLSSSFHHPESK
jgi:hypothetical protein